MTNSILPVTVLDSSDTTAPAGRSETNSVLLPVSSRRERRPMMMSTALTQRSRRGTPSEMPLTVTCSAAP
eukprot:6629109-Lingulodinium_polyedra.AAC.1